jgi:hypothetical protein
MSRRAAKFTQADITRAIKGGMASGVPVCITVDPRNGIIKIEPIVDRDEDGPDPNRPIIL